jgi:hypothetical protein
MSTRRPGSSGPMTRSLRGVFAVRYCDSLEYALRMLGEIVLFAAALAALKWLLPVVRLPGLTAWPGTCQAAAVAACGTLTVLDMTLLRLRRTESDSSASGHTGAAGQGNTYISAPRRSIYAVIAAAAAVVTAIILSVLLVAIPLLNAANRAVNRIPGDIVSQVSGDYAGYYDQVQMQLQQAAATTSASAHP